MKVKVDWDIEGCSEMEVDLPYVVVIPDMDDDEVADYLSDKHGFCVNSWYEL